VTVALTDLKFPEPTLLELVEQLCVTPSGFRRVYENRDDGDEEPRRYVLFVCGGPRFGGKYCLQDPHYWGPCDPTTKL